MKLVHPYRLTVDAARFAGNFAVFATFDGLVRVGAGRDRVCSLDLERATATTGLRSFCADPDVRRPSDINKLLPQFLRDHGDSTSMINIIAKFALGFSGEQRSCLATRTHICLWGPLSRWVSCLSEVWCVEVEWKASIISGHIT